MRVVAWTASRLFANLGEDKQSRMAIETPIALVFLLASLLVDPAPPPRPRPAPPGAEERVARIDAALVRAADYLLARQSPDGAWRSGVHGTFRDGVGLTPLVCSTLYFLDTPDARNRAGAKRAIDWLLGFVDERGQLVQDFAHPPFPVYSLSMASWCATLDGRDDRRTRAERAFLNALLSRQLNEANGWPGDDPDFGGWGYFFDTPKKPDDPRLRHPLLRSNLSATVFAIGAMKHAKHDLGGQPWQDALRFVQRCQNFADAAAGRDPDFDDGGFVFGPGDAAGNKPGIAGVDRFGRTRLRSYGSMTADGLRALIQCGLEVDHPRVQAAIGWIARNWSATTNPGRFEQDRVVLRDASYFYWCWSASHALFRAGVATLDTPAGKVAWAESLADALIDRQREDGSWKSDNSEGREDDPLVATAFAAAALRVCRDQLTLPAVKR